MNILILFLLLYNKLSTSTDFLIIYLLLSSNTFNSHQSMKNINNNNCNHLSYKNPKDLYDNNANNPSENTRLLNKKYNTKNCTQSNNLYASTNTHFPKDNIISKKAPKITTYYYYDGSKNLVRYKEEISVTNSCTEPKLSNKSPHHIINATNNALNNSRDSYPQEKHVSSKASSKKTTYYYYDNLGNLIPYEKHSNINNNMTKTSKNSSNDTTYINNNNLGYSTDPYLSKEYVNSKNLHKKTTYYCYDDLGNLIPYEKYDNYTTSKESNISTNYMAHMGNNILNNSTYSDLSKEYVDLSEEYISLETSHEQTPQQYYNDFEPSDTYKEKSSINDNKKTSKRHSNHRSSTKKNNINTYHSKENTKSKRSSKNTNKSTKDQATNPSLSTQNDSSSQESTSIEEEINNTTTKTQPQMPPYLEDLKTIGAPLKELTNDINSPFQNISSLKSTIAPLKDLTKMDFFDELSNSKEILIPLEDFKSE